MTGVITDSVTGSLTGSVTGSRTGSMTVPERVGRIWAFVAERCLPVYPIYLALWVVAAESMTAMVTTSAGTWRPTWDTAFKTLALLAAGAFLRMVDDQKDLDYDGLHNPDRPLPQGRITHTELRTAMGPTAALALALAAVVSLPAAAALAAALGYGLALWWVESRGSWVRDNPIVNLALVCPAQFLVTAFIMSQPSLGHASWGRLLAVPVVFTSAILHVEIATKTRRGGTRDPHSYSQLIGAPASAKAAWAFGMLAVAVELTMTAPWRCAEHDWLVAWMPLAAAILPCASAWTFLVGGADRHPRSWPTIFVVVFYLSVIAQGLAHP